MTIHYLGLGEVAERLGLSRNTLNGYGRKGKLPTPNALIGDIRGWLPETVDEWNRRRPGQRPTREGEDWHVMRHSTIRYVSAPELAERIGVRRQTINRYKLPLTDAEIGDVRGWLPQTIDEWIARRPGKRLPADQADWNLPPALQR
ncbi:helix-turn-helix transcriptional regulator [Nocardia abscessus]|uniref:helix-turn-helix transcriptional regulator n=1 Tax=Nocardia abscessus TaxID=120957 RepID=UPI002458095D|nr:hypothetical protein [Nocardia abscessus]